MTEHEKVRAAALEEAAKWHDQLVENYHHNGAATRDEMIAQSCARVLHTGAAEHHRLTVSFPATHVVVERAVLAQVREALEAQGYTPHRKGGWCSGRCPVSSHGEDCEKGRAVLSVLMCWVGA